MDKQEFLSELREKLTGLPETEIDERVSFYREMIEDRMEEGLSEEDAVLAAGAIDEIITQTIADTSLSKIAKDRFKSKGSLSPFELLLLIIGSPIWLSILIAVIAVIFSLYISLWSVIVSLWAVFASAVACCTAGVIAGIVMICIGKVHAGIALISGGAVCAGLAILLCLTSKAATAGMTLLSKKLVLWIKRCFIRKGDK